MKNAGIAFLVLSFLAICMANSFAQAPLTGVTPFNYPQSTLSGDTGVTAGWFGSYLQLEPSLHSPRLFAAWSPNASSIKIAPTANAYGNALNNGYGNGTLEWSTNGVWLGLSIPAQVNKWLSADLQGWYFLPSNRHIEVSGVASGFLNGVFTSGGVSGNVDIDTTWFATDLEGCFHASSEFAVLAGVRYDYLQGTITLPGPLEAMVLSQLPGLRPKLDFNLDSIFPYFGFKSSLSSGQHSLTLSIKGFPWAISVGDTHPKSGYFAEAFLSYKVVPSRDFTLSLFAKADVAHAVFDQLSQVGNIFGKNLPVPQNISVEQSLPVTWHQYLIGGVATLKFELPFL